ncbi:VOC family protein [uncultured Lamprocystis sp.]|jgi:predicted 3-demethylubiquinone-9 3-methyltransferase (glyoxalase superfamily)|uniref:VOC family protein n=1 Tax=uncultured Lamprocystis sp. TaxID=543132 RepID=UPI0025F30D7C|nr:VOC family protein [uncultured Lamprocystis sp.]
MSKIAPCLWFNGEAEAAAALYVSLFPDASVAAVSRYGEGMPFPAGTAMMVEFTLAGQRFQALNGGPQFPHTAAISLSVDCATQAELDHFWQGLTADGGAPGQCGWLKDRFGVSWQIVPMALGEIMTRDDVAGKARALQAMMGMTKLDICALEAAYAGTTP